ncbi:unnamed protein product [Commensalibacter papalotli (ex Botero et al. 2024)]|nr:unnamed protein product [Commensalibacter papalotli (ex Botero et al. 2024)]
MINNKTTTKEIIEFLLNRHCRAFIDDSASINEQKLFSTLQDADMYAGRLLKESDPTQGRP